MSDLALAHGYDTTFWWIAGILAVGAVVTGALLRNGPLSLADTESPTSSLKTMTELGELLNSFDRRFDSVILLSLLGGSIRFYG